MRPIMYGIDAVPPGVSKDIVFTQWNGTQCVEKLKGKTKKGMVRACQFVAGRARDNAPVRSGRLRGGIDYVVIAHKDEVDGIVGVTRKSKAWYARFVELGTKYKAYQPERMAVKKGPGVSKVRHRKAIRMSPARKAHPFLYPAVFNNGAEITRMIAGGQ